MNNILIINNDHILNNILKVILESIGYSVNSLNNGENVRNRILKIKPELLIIDKNIQEINYFDLIKSLNNEKDYTNFSIILIHKKSDQPLQKELMLKYKIKACLEKPFDNNKFIEKVTSLLPFRKPKSDNSIKSTKSHFSLVNNVEQLESLEYMKKIIRRTVILGKCWKGLLKDIDNIQLLSQMIELSDFSEFTQISLKQDSFFNTTRSFNISLQKIKNQSIKLDGKIVKDIENAITKINNFILKFITNNKNATTFFENQKIISNIDKNRNIYIAGSLTDEIKSLIGYFDKRGFKTKFFDDLYDLMVYVSYDTAIAIIVDYSFIKKSINAIELLKHISKPELLSIPIMFISEIDTFQTRLNAVKASGHGFFPKPLNYPSILEEIKLYTNDELEEPYRVLLVENKNKFPQSIIFFLNSSGFEVEVTSEMSSSLTIIPIFKPDCIILSNNKSNSKCYDYINVLYQFNNFKNLPVIFLNEKPSRKDENITLYSNYQFIPADTSPAILISKINYSAAMYRKQTKKERREVSTGLYNIKEFKRKMDIEISRAKRESKTIVLALLEIDNEKLLMEKLGANFYEKILMDFSKILNNTIRKVDIVGNINQKRFCIVFTQFGKDNAIIVIKKLQKAFYTFEKNHTNSNISFSISCGIAEYPDFENSSLLMFSAEKALINAKQSENGAIICSLPKK